MPRPSIRSGRRRRNRRAIRLDGHPAHTLDLVRFDRVQGLPAKLRLKGKFAHLCNEPCRMLLLLARDEQSASSSRATRGLTEVRATAGQRRASRPSRRSRRALRSSFAPQFHPPTSKPRKTSVTPRSSAPAPASPAASCARCGQATCARPSYAVLAPVHPRGRVRSRRCSASPSCALRAAPRLVPQRSLAQRAYDAIRSWVDRSAVDPLDREETQELCCFARR